MLTVKALDKTSAHEARWQAYVASNRDATIYHDIAWRLIYEEAFRYRSYCLFVEDDHGNTRGILPLFLVPSPLGRPRLVSVPFRDRGGPLFDDTDAFASLIDGADRLRRDVGALCVEIKTLSPYPETLVDPSRLRRIDHWVHSAASLAGLTEDRLLKLVGDKTRNMIRQAERAGLRLVESNIDNVAIGLWYRLHQTSHKSLGLPPLPRRFFEFIFAELSEQRRVRLHFVLDRASTPVAGCILFKEATRAIYAYSASTPQDRKVRPNDLMLFRIICSLSKEGCEAFDFGSDSPHQSGLLFFKRKWLAEQRVIPRYYISGAQTPTMTDSSASRYDLPRRLTQRLPLPLARWMLAPLVRYFG